MAKYNEFLYDEIGNSYERKNQYLKEVAILESKIEDASGSEKSTLKEELKLLKANKKQHKYMIALEAFFDKEKAFKTDLRNKVKSFRNSQKGKYSNKVLNLKIDLLKSQEELSFYNKYTDLSYEATLTYEESLIKCEQLAEIIEFVLKNEKALSDAKAEEKTIQDSDEKKVQASYDAFKLEQKEKFKLDYIALKQKKKDGLISDKALKNGRIELKKKMQEALSVKSFESKKKSNKEMIRSLKFQLNKGTKREITVMNSNISDLRRKTPVESKKKQAIVAYLTFLIPGLGQVLNGQAKKSLLFFMLSIFVYFAAIPYALGFGNYQGTGISGLLSLAEGGKKIDRSLIFMIEGIVAVYLVLFVVAILFISFRDVKNVEQSKIKGIREKNWFETWSNVTEEGFPYMVSLPALVAIVFIVLVPITTAILLSFTNMDPSHQNKFMWIGIDNYKMIALGEGVAGGPFWKILGWTVMWTAFATTLAIAVGFMLALLTNNERVKGKVFFRSIYILPWAVPAFITIMFFSIMFSPKGALTEILNNIIQTDSLIVVKNDPFWSRLTLIGLQAWLGSAYVFLLSTGVLQGIPADLYEAAQIDGATAWQKLKRITLPIVLFQTAPLLIGQYTFNFNNFSIIYLFNGGGPFNPTKYGNLAGSTDLLISYIYKLTTENDYQAIGAAITIVISMGLMLFAFIGFKNSKAFKEEKL